MSINSEESSSITMELAKRTMGQATCGHKIKPNTSRRCSITGHQMVSQSCSAVQRCNQETVSYASKCERNNSTVLIPLPHNSTCNNWYCPTELLMHQRLKKSFHDSLHPNVTGRVHDNQKQQKRNHDTHARLRSF